MSGRLATEACPQCGYLPPDYFVHLGLPVGEMIERGWLDHALDVSDKKQVEQALARFFRVDTVSELKKLLNKETQS